MTPNQGAWQNASLHDDAVMVCTRADEFIAEILKWRSYTPVESVRFQALVMALLEATKP